jgi:hypothetical protein
MPLITTRTLPLQRGSEPMPRALKAPLRLSERTLTWMTDRPHARTLVHSIWNELTEREATGELPEVLATLRFLLIEHQFLTRSGRCRGCRRDWRRSWRLWRPGFPCRIWFILDLGLQGFYTRLPVTGLPSEGTPGRHARRNPL